MKQSARSFPGSPCARARRAGAATLTGLLACLSHVTAAQAVPSGTSVELYEVILDQVGGEAWVRFRFLAPEIARDAGNITFTDIASDFYHLCTKVALPYLDEFDLKAEVVVVAMSDRPVEFGVADADATQFIEAFRVTSGACQWEEF